MGKLFGKSIRKEKIKPDAIVCSWPLIEMTYEAVKYGKKNGIPVVIDIRDLWPDIFVQPFKGLKKLIIKMIVYLLYHHKVSYSVKNAYQIIGVTRDAVDLAYKWGRKQNNIDTTLFLSTKKKDYDTNIINQSIENWKKMGIKDGDYIFIFVGSIQLRIEKLDVIVEAAKRTPNAKFVFCGDGYSRLELIDMYKDLTNVFFPGYLNELDINVLSKMATCAFLPYCNLPDFINSLPNKLGEYLSNGLPVLTSLKGDARKILEENKCGVYYSNVDELCNEINRYCSDSRYLSKSKENSLQLYEKCFNSDMTYMRFFESLKNRKEEIIK